MFIEVTHILTPSENTTIKRIVNINNIAMYESSILKSGNDKYPCTKVFTNINEKLYITQTYDELRKLIQDASK